MRRLLAALLLLFAPATASARANDLNLAGLVLRSGTPTFDRNIHTPLFRQLATELGISIAPHFTSPAETLGSLGFEIGISTAATNIHQDAPYWTNARRTDEAADSALVMTTLHLRKGLPASFELAGNVGWVANSEMWAMGIELKWALNEGFYYIPDVALRGSVNVLVGARDLQVITSGFDISLSKAFAVGGTTSLTPYTGYNLLVINANSHVLDPTPLDLTDIERNFVFAPETLIAHRMFVGLRFKTYFVTLTGAVELAWAQKGDVPFLQTYLAKLAFDF
jgi:hypothetical protein